MANENDIRFALKAVDEISAVIDKIQSKLPGLRKEIDRTNQASEKKSSFTRFGEQMSGVGKSLSSFGSRLSAGVSLPLFFAGKKAVETASNFQALDIALTTMLGSAEKATQLRQELTAFAAKTPFQITEIGDTAKQLLAVGISQDKLIPTMKSLGDVAAGLNIPLERIIMNYGQVRTQNKLTGREMKDFLVAGIPLNEELAKQFKVKKSAIPDMVSKGLVSFKDVEKVFQSMTGKGGKFADMMEKLAQLTFMGKLSNLIDKLTLFGGQIGFEIIPDLEKFMEKISQLASWFSALDPSTKKLIARIAMFAVVLGPALFYIGMMAQGLGGLSIAFGFFGKMLNSTKILMPKIIALFTGMSLATAGWIIAIGALVAAGVYLYKNWDRVKTLFSNFWPQAKDMAVNFATKVGSLLSKMWNGPLFSILKFIVPIFRLMAIAQFVYNHWAPIKDFFIKLWDGPIKSFLRFISPIDEIIAAAGYIKEVWAPIGYVLANIWDDATQRFNAFIQNIKDKFKAIGTLIDFAVFGSSGQLFSDATRTDGNGNVSMNSAKGAFEQLAYGPSLADSLISPQSVTQTNNSKIVVDFKNLPKGTNVKQFGSDSLDLNLGYAGI